MKPELKELFDGLNKLCEMNDAFYYSEQALGDRYVVRSYTYRLASWTEFQEPFAKDCRGTAFVLDKSTGEWELFTRAYRKFFNLGEGIPKNQLIAECKPVKSFEKLDGSLILFGIVGGKVIAKSKTSINSDHAKKAQELIQENKKLYDYIYMIIGAGETPVFELVGPKEFKIVLNYSETELVLLGFVDHSTGKVRTPENIRSNIRENIGIRTAESYDYSWGELLGIQENSKPCIEGFVTLLDSGEFVKVKVQSYVKLHHLKDNISNLTNLIPLILDDNLDDLMGQFAEDQDTLDYITEIQGKISKIHNHTVVQFLDLREKYFTYPDRKTFAAEFNSIPIFSYVMRSLNTTTEDSLEVQAEKEAKSWIHSCTKKAKEAEKFIESYKTF